MSKVVRTLVKLHSYYLLFNNFNFRNFFKYLIIYNNCFINLIINFIQRQMRGREWKKLLRAKSPTTFI